MRSHQLLELLVGDEPEAWAAAGFSVTDGCTVIDGVRIRLTGADGPRGIHSIAIDGVAGSVDGIATHVPEPGDLVLADHPNGVTHIDHLVVTTGNPDRTTAALADYDIEARRTRVLGAEGRETRQTFFWLGDVILEMAGPDAGGRSDPAVAWGLALTSDDIDATAGALGDRITPPKDAVQAGRRIATITTRDLDISTALAVMSPHPS